MLQRHFFRVLKAHWCFNPSSIALIDSSFLSIPVKQAAGCRVLDTSRMDMDNSDAIDCLAGSRISRDSKFWRSARACCSAVSGASGEGLLDLLSTFFATY